VEEQQKAHYPMMFVVSIALFFLFSLLRALSCFWLINTSSTNMHNAACKAVLRAKILFFDSNPIGRIVTRFSKDIMVIDFMLAIFMIVIAQGILRSVTVMITVAIINPWLFIVAVVSLCAMILVMRRVVAPMQSSQVLDGIYRGPIHTTFSLVVQGLVTLRAFDKIAYFK
jgi:ATP-binding cassette, subfamily C (CFTR/MRP), member 4